MVFAFPPLVCGLYHLQSGVAVKWSHFVGCSHPHLTELSESALNEASVPTNQKPPSAATS
jgi:hypothetical protein